MSSIVVSENFKNLWKSGARRQVDSMTESLREYVLPPPASEQEPLPEELDDITAAIAPFIGGATLTAPVLAATLAGHAASLGVRPQSMYPLYFMGGINEIMVPDNRLMLLQFPDRAGLPIINTAPFPIRLGSNDQNISRIRGLSDRYRNRLLFMSYDSLLMDICPFTSVEQRDECIGSGGRISTPYASADHGWCIYQTSAPMRYSGCYRLPTPEELDTFFAGIPDGTVLQFTPYGPPDFFGTYGMRGRDIEAARFREPTPAASADVRPGNATNVPPQDFSGEPRRPRRNSDRLTIGAPRPRPVRHNPSAPSVAGGMTLGDGVISANPRPIFTTRHVQSLVHDDEPLVYSEVDEQAVASMEWRTSPTPIFVQPPAPPPAAPTSQPW